MVVRQTLISIMPFILSLIIVFIAISDFYYFKELGSNGSSLDHGNQVPLQYFKTIFNKFRGLMFADFTDVVDEYDIIDFTVLMLTSIIIMVVLMNLLISIISDSHEKVQASLRKSSGLILCELIHELESSPLLRCIVECRRRRFEEE